jgi:hypothetical protein
MKQTPPEATFSNERTLFMKKPLEAIFHTTIFIFDENKTA